MKTIQVKYHQKSKEWLADISLVGQDIYNSKDKLWLVYKLHNVLCERYGSVDDWNINQLYN